MEQLWTEDMLIRCSIFAVRDLCMQLQGCERCSTGCVYDNFEISLNSQIAPVGTYKSHVSLFGVNSGANMGFLITSIDQSDLWTVTVT